MKPAPPALPDFARSLSEPTEAVPESNDARELLSSLAKLDPIAYDRSRETTAAQLGVRVTALDEAVRRTRQPTDDEQGSAVSFREIRPHAEAVSGAAMLGELTSTLQRFVVLPKFAPEAISLWIVLTYVIDCVRVAPILAICSPDKRCGKSTLLALLDRLVARALVSSNISPAALFRVVEKHRPTLLIDEADSFLRENEELRGVLNSGHTRDTAFVVRCVGDDSEPRRFSTWGCKAIALIGGLPGTLTDRAMVIEMQRKSPAERVQRLRHAPADLFEELAARIARWSQDHAEAIRQARPEIPDELHDRAQDNWEPLVAIADRAGGEWPTLARQVALALSDSAPTGDSLKVELLRDVQRIFVDLGEDRISSEDLVADLINDKERPWADYRHGRPITQKQLAGLLTPLHIISRAVRLKDGRNLKGYMREWFEDAFLRYTPSSETSHRHEPAPVRLVTDRASVTGSPCDVSLFPSQTRVVSPDVVYESWFS